MVNMLKIAVVWLLLDAIAIFIMLYDYRKWYGPGHPIFPSRRRHFKRTTTTAKAA
jgi:hypothetical protein